VERGPAGDKLPALKGKEKFMIRPVVAFLAAGALVLSSAVFADEGGFNASRTFEFDPDHTGCVSARWSKRIGETDSNCKTNFGLLLAKECATSTFASAGAVLNNIKGAMVQCGPTLGYDIKDGSTCEAGSPRFNVSYTTAANVSGFSFVGGCANGTKVSLGNGWSRVTFDPCSPTQAFPPIPAGSTYTSVVLIVDDMGSYTLDNIQINGLYTDKPGSSGTLPSCTP
jgi:hypothetical protein